MQSIDELIKELKLTEPQAVAIKKYFADSVIELLESLKTDNQQNFDETIASLRQK